VKEIAVKLCRIHPTSFVAQIMGIPLKNIRRWRKSVNPVKKEEEIDAEVEGKLV
jgi:hypothetical protein